MALTFTQEQLEDCVARLVEHHAEGHMPLAEQMASVQWEMHGHPSWWHIQIQAKARLTLCMEVFISRCAAQGISIMQEQ